MTAIIDYGERPAYLLYQLEKLGVDQKFTSVESEILAADRIILPDCSDIKKALKRLHLLNLFSMLKMIQKPVLGIANGFSLMCENPHVPGSIYVWLTDDDIKMPVKVKTKVVIGSIDAELTKYEGLAGKLTSKR